MVMLITSRTQRDTQELLKSLEERDTMSDIMVNWVNIFQTDFMAEIYSKSPVRAFGKVLRMNFS